MSIQSNGLPGERDQAASVTEKINQDLAIYARSFEFEMLVTTKTDQYASILSKSDIRIDLAVLRQTVALNLILKKEKELAECFEKLR